MDRRVFVKLTAFSAAALSLPLLSNCSGSAVQQEISVPDLLASILDKETLINIGKQYLSRTSAEHDVDELVPLLLTDNHFRESSDAKAIHVFLNDKIKQDFQTANTITIDGWVLAVTEARQCALYYLLKK